jgi:hypothetical protein
VRRSRGKAPVDGIVNSIYKWWISILEKGTTITNEEKQFLDWEKRLRRAERELEARKSVSLQSLKTKRESEKK